MRKGRFSEGQMVAIIREADRDPVAAVAKRHGISEQTIYTWAKRFGGLQASDVKRLRQLEVENGRLKKLVAERDLEIETGYHDNVSHSEDFRSKGVAAGRALALASGKWPSPNKPVAEEVCQRICAYLMTLPLQLRITMARSLRPFFPFGATDRGHSVARRIAVAIEVYIGRIFGII